MGDPIPQKAPSSSQRQLCYNARDKYYKCLEGNKLTDNSEESTVCEQLRKQYHTNCLPSWVKYFERKRVFDQYKKKLEEEGFHEDTKES